MQVSLRKTALQHSYSKEVRVFKTFVGISAPRQKIFR